MTVDVGDFRGMSAEQVLQESGRTWEAIVAAVQGVEELVVTAEAGNGSVVAVADGRGALTELRFSTRALRYPDADRLAGHMLAAIHRAEQDAALRRDELLDAVEFAGVPLSRISAGVAASATASGISHLEEEAPWRR